MIRRSFVAAALALSLVPAGRLMAQSEAIDAPMLARIREEGLRHSQVMDHISWLADVYGPRLTGSPTMDQAAEWAMKTLRSWGIANVHQERFAFGKGWSLVRFNAQMIEPQVMPIIGMPESWTTGTKGRVTADVVLAPIRSEDDFAMYRGRLRGRIVLTQPEREVNMLEGRIVLKMNEQDIREALSEPPPPPPAGRGGRGGPPGGRGGANASGPSLQQRIARFQVDEGALALIERGPDSDMATGGSDLSWQTQKTDGGTFGVGSGGSRDESACSLRPQRGPCADLTSKKMRAWPSWILSTGAVEG